MIGGGNLFINKNTLISERKESVEVFLHVAERTWHGVKDINLNGVTYRVRTTSDSSMCEKFIGSIVRIPKMRELNGIGTMLGLKDADISNSMKMYLLREVELYDKSDSVECFSMDGARMWLDYTMRTKLRECLESSQSEGRENITLMFGGLTFCIPIDKGWQMYYALLKYARDSWNVTEQHKVTIPELTEINEIISYEDSIASSYPTRLSFKSNEI